MSTGHTTYTTFHADSVGEVLKRFTTEPINVSKTMFTALDLVSVQTQTRVQGTKVRRNKSLTEINHYDAENDEINVQDVYEWRAEADEFAHLGNSNTLEEIKFDRGWDDDQLDEEIFKRQVVLAYLIRENLNEYAQVAATLQAFINDPDTILGLIATGNLEASLEDLREMESVLIDIDPEKEKMVPRPEPNDRAYERAREILAEAEERLFEEYRDVEPGSISTALAVRMDDSSDSRPARRDDPDGESTTEASFDDEPSIDDLLDGGQLDADVSSEDAVKDDELDVDGMTEPDGTGWSSAASGDGMDRPRDEEPTAADPGEPETADPGEATATDPREASEERDFPVRPDDPDGVVEEHVAGLEGDGDDADVSHSESDVDETDGDEVGFDVPEPEAEERTDGESEFDHEPERDDPPGNDLLDDGSVGNDRTATDDATASGDARDPSADEPPAPDRDGTTDDGPAFDDATPETDDDVEDVAGDRDERIGDEHGSVSDTDRDDAIDDGVSPESGDDEVDAGKDDEDDAGNDQPSDDQDAQLSDDEDAQLSDDEDTFGEFETVRFEDEEDSGEEREEGA
jgi:flagellar protein FlaI